MAKKDKNKLLFLITDGVCGIFALFLFNFILYISSLCGGAVSKIKNDTGYFYILALKNFGFSDASLFTWIISLFLFAFLIGIFFGKLVRKRRSK